MQANQANQSNQQTQINLSLTQQESLALVQVLGELPTKTGAYVLMHKIQEQVQQQTTDSQGVK